MTAGLLLGALLGYAAPAAGVDHVTFRREGKERTLAGRILVTAQDGGLLLQTSDGVIWAIQPEEKVAVRSDQGPFDPLKREALAAQLLAELPAGFKVHYTAHYVICYDTSRAYAQWCGGLFERLQQAFTTYWKRNGFELQEPEFPLVAIIFADRNAYLKFTRAELGEAGESIVAFYSFTSNRMTLYDLTGVESVSRLPARHADQQINQVLSQPRAQQAVATIVHEAVHQIAFNCGLHARLSDCPLWFSEGIAVFFETPDLRSAKGWSGMGAVNPPRLAQFAGYLRNRPADSLKSLIEDDRRFRDTQHSLDAYAEAWALTYFLMKQRPKQYVEYLRALSRKKPMIMDAPAERVKEFEKAFGTLNSVDEDFLRAMRKLL